MKATVRWGQGTGNRTATKIDETARPKLRATVHRDPYEFQSWAKIEQWSNSKGWLEITTLPINDVSEDDGIALGQMLAIGDVFNEEN